MLNPVNRLDGVVADEGPASWPGAPPPASSSWMGSACSDAIPKSKANPRRGGGGIIIAIGGGAGSGGGCTTPVVPPARYDKSPPDAPNNTMVLTRSSVLPDLLEGVGDAGQ